MNEQTFQSKTSKLSTSKGLTRPTKATEPKEKHSATNKEGPQTKRKHYNQIRTEPAIYSILAKRSIFSRINKLALP
jgi:hypothetical protein